MSNIPRSLQEFIILQRLPGYTRADLLAEDADTVRDWWIYLHAEMKEND